jgi:hypothetical protein
VLSGSQSKQFNSSILSSDFMCLVLTDASDGDRAGGSSRVDLDSGIPEVTMFDCAIDQTQKQKALVEDPAKSDMPKFRGSQSQFF